jgi:hypothetical protein
LRHVLPAEGHFLHSLRGVAVVHWRRSTWAAAAVAGALFTGVIAAPDLAHAGGLFDFLFGGPQDRQQPAPVESYAEPSAPIAPVAPVPSGPESVRQGGGGGGRYVAYCVRLCDGLHFPMEHLTNATPVETCRAMCPASKTKVFFGTGIDQAVAKDGAHYADLDSAFVYRKQFVANCTCNGKDAFGLAPFDLSRDPTLQPGDIVSTKDGFVAYSGSGQSYTRVNPSTLTAELNGIATSRAPAATRLTRDIEPPSPDDDPGTITPSAPAPRRQADR